MLTTSAQRAIRVLSCNINKPKRTVCIVDGVEKWQHLTAEDADVVMATIEQEMYCNGNDSLLRLLCSLCHTHTVHWKQAATLQFAHRSGEPNLLRYFAPEGKNYRYRSTKYKATPHTTLTAALCQFLTSTRVVFIPILTTHTHTHTELSGFAVTFEGLFVRMYRDGNDSLSSHSDGTGM